MVAGAKLHLHTVGIGTHVRHEGGVVGPRTNLTRSRRTENAQLCTLARRPGGGGHPCQLPDSEGTRVGPCAHVEFLCTRRDRRDSVTLAVMDLLVAIVICTID
jgi:hypothetical protein